MNLSSAEKRALRRLSEGKNSGARQQRTVENLVEKGALTGSRRGGYVLTDAGRAEAKRMRKAMGK